jgi:predicted nucleic acid-binding protein
MPVKVIDASAVAEILFNEPDADEVLARIADDSLLAPPLITLEVASVCLKKIRTHPRQRDALLASFDLMARLDIEIAPVDLAESISLAEHTRLTVYDACYLWLAQELRCEVLTLDKKLASASKNRRGL